MNEFNLLLYVCGFGSGIGVTLMYLAFFEKDKDIR